MSEPDNWAQRLLGSGPAYRPVAQPGPRRVSDGVLDETLRRPVWCVRAVNLRRVVGALDSLVALLERHGRVVELLEDDDDSVSAACDRRGVTPADVVHVDAAPGADAIGDPESAADGARRLVIGQVPERRRGIVVVPDVDALAALFTGAGRYVSDSTYHEV